MQAWDRGTPMLASSGYVSVVDGNLCEVWGHCSSFCQFGAISLNNGYAAVDDAACMGCGVCVSKCEQDALSLVLDPGRGEPLVIRELMASPGRDV